MTIHTDDTKPGTHRSPHVGLRSRRARLATVGGLLLAGAVALAACGSSTNNAAANNSGSGTGTGTGTTTSAASTSSSATVHAASTSSGTVLENGSDMALYTFGPDGTGAQSKCTGACAAAWPALTVSAGTTPTAASGVSGTFATSKQSNGSEQVTYNGKLLYTFLSDSPGKVTGNGVASFSVVKVSSSATNANAGSSGGTSPTTMASGNTGGYHY